MSQEGKWWEGIPRIQAAEGLGGRRPCDVLEAEPLYCWAVKSSLGPWTKAKDMSNFEVIAPLIGSFSVKETEATGLAKDLAWCQKV